MSVSNKKFGAGLVVGLAALYFIVQSGDEPSPTDSSSGSLPHRAEAEDTSAEADVFRIGIEVNTYMVDHTTLPDVWSEGFGGQYYVDDIPIGYASQNVVLGTFPGGAGIAGTSSDWCVYTSNPEGMVRDFQYSSREGLEPGNCGDFAP